MIKHFGQNPFAPNFTICKSEGGTANCPSEYVKEFSGLGALPFPLQNPWVMLASGVAVAVLLEKILDRPLVEIVSMGRWRVSR